MGRGPWGGWAGWQGRGGREGDTQLSPPQPRSPAWFAWSKRVPRSHRGTGRSSSEYTFLSDACDRLLFPPTDAAPLGLLPPLEPHLCSWGGNRTFPRLGPEGSSTLGVGMEGGNEHSGPWEPREPGGAVREGFLEEAGGTGGSKTELGEEGARKPHPRPLHTPVLLCFAPTRDRVTPGSSPPPGEAPK